MMKDFAIYCAGGFGREIYCLIFKRIMNPYWNFIGYFDDGIEKGKELQYGKCLGGIDELNVWKTPIDVCIATGSPHILKSISEKICNPLVEFPNIIDPATYIADPETVKLGKGNIFNGDNSLSVNVQIGDFNVFNSADHFGHDAKVGSFNAFMPNIRISGNVSIGNENLFGACSFILQGLSVGNNITLSPGSILLTKTKDGNIYIGNPAKEFKY